MAERARRAAWLPWLVIGVLGTLLLTGGIATFDPFGTLFDRGGQIDRSGPVIVESVRDLSELSTVEVVESTTVEKGQDRGWLDWATGDRIFLFAVARIRAGVDLSALEGNDVTIDEEANAITLRLPAPQVTGVEVDNEQTRVYDRDTGVFTGGDDDLERSARLAAEELMVDAALEDGLLERARDNTELALTELFTSVGYDEVTITFDAPDPARG